MPIYVETDNTKKGEKLFDASMSGSAATAAEAKMQKMVKDAMDKEAGFTTTKTQDAKGYFVRLKISKFEANGSTKCTISGSIERYPKTMTKSRGAGAEMVTTGWSGSAEASGTSVGSVVNCVEAITESMLPKGITAMKNDMIKR
jgi:hypothetical protein